MHSQVVFSHHATHLAEAVDSILTINGGSSSIRFAVFSAAKPRQRMFAGRLERLGSGAASMTAGKVGTKPRTVKLPATDRSGIATLVEWLAAHADAPPAVIGHRVVHGLEHVQPERITPQLLDYLHSISAFDPEHLPREIELMAALQAHYGDAASQVACFDTAFHAGLPAVAKTLPLPERFAETRVHRYGFHGLSYTYLLDELRRLEPPVAEHGRVVLAHLGSGASMAAVLAGHCIDTSMGFTATGGLVMGTRSGDLDPGLLCYLLRRHGLSSQDLEHAINHEAGMLGVSGGSADVRDLLEREAREPRARLALELFCYQAKKFLGAFVAALGGLDTLVFAGGVGENAAVVRTRICDSLDCFGIRLDAERNNRHDAVISVRDAAVTVRVIPTDEEAVIARLSGDLVGAN